MSDIKGKDNAGDQVKTDADGKLVSKFMTDATSIKERLDAVSPSLCLAKWNQVSLHLPTGLNNSCYHPPLHKIPLDEVQVDVSALHNTSHKKIQRKMMLDGFRPPECQYCWNIEDTGNLSDRHYRSGEPWAAKDFDKIVNGPWDANVTPSYVEVNFSHGCNLKCSYCSPQFSSTWEKEIADFGAYPTSTKHNSPEYFTGDNKPMPVREYNPYVEAFWEWWPELYKNLDHFRMTGGEPLMDKNTYRVFDWVLANPKPKLILNTTSNFSVDDKLFTKYMDYVTRLCDPDANNVDHFMQYVSLDTWGEQAEYLRYGLDFNKMWSNVHYFLENVPYKSSLTFIITMNNLSLTNLHKLIEAILELRQKYSSTYQRVWFDTPLLRKPDWQSLQIMPAEYAFDLEHIKEYMNANLETVNTRFKGFKDYEVQRIERDIAWMRNGKDLPVALVQRHKADFYKFFNEHDRRRGTNFLKTFPELSSWWEQCRYFAENNQ